MFRRGSYPHKTAIHKAATHKVTIQQNRSRQKWEEKKAREPALVVNQTIKLEPGWFTTFMLLNAAFFAMQPALGLAVPHVSSGDRLANDIVDKNVFHSANHYSGSHPNDCRHVIAATANTNQVAYQNLQKAFFQVGVTMYCNLQQHRLAAYDPSRGIMFINPKADAASVNRAAIRANAFFRHKSGSCNEGNLVAAAAPFYPTGEQQYQRYVDALNAGDKRIDYFKDLLHRFKLLDIKAQKQIIEALNTDHINFRKFRSLIFQNKMAMQFTRNDIQNLEEYLKASRDCFTYDMQVTFNDKTKLAGEGGLTFESDEAIYYSVNSVNQNDTNHVEFNGQYAHKFEAVSHITDYMRAHWNEMPSDRYTQFRVFFVQSVLSENAMQIFYPELAALALEDVNNCEETRRFTP